MFQAEDIGPNFHDAMLGVANYLEAVDTAIDHDKELKQEANEYNWQMQQENEQFDW